MDGLLERQEARAQLIRDRAEAQIETGRLKLLVTERRRRGDPGRLDGSPQGHVGKDAGAGCAVSGPHAAHYRLTAPSVSTANARACPSIPPARSAVSMARATGPVSSPTAASSDGPEPESTQPRAPARRAASTTAGIHGKSRRRYGWCSRSSSAVSK